MMIKIPLSLICAFFFQSLLFSQLSNQEYEACLKNEKLEILNEDMKISFNGQKAEYINVVFEKEVEYKIHNIEENFLIFPIPEQMDPTYNPINSKVRNANRKLDDIRISKFEANIQKPDGTIISAQVTRHEIVEKIVTEDNYFGKLYSYDYKVGTMENGDILKINYKYTCRYVYNYFRMFSYRMFLHGVHPKKNYKLTISHHFDLEVDTFFMNDSRPNIEMIDNHMFYKWEASNLPGCLDEAGSRPYMELPWFTFTVKPYELLYQDYNSFRETFVPMWYYIIFNRERQLRSAVVDIEIGTKDKDNLKFEKLARRFTKMAPDDTTGLARLRYFQRYMADSVTYDDDYKYYNREENYLKDHPGIQLYGRKVKDHLKEFVYASMIPKMGFDYLTAYISDKRSGAMSKDYYAPVYDNELLFATIVGNSFTFVLPKSDTRNLYFEELPFYYEFSPTLLISTYDFAGYKRNFNEVIRLLETPGSDLTDNYRKVNSMVKINLQQGSIEFNTKISLSGQYSTSTRFNYEERAGDSTINPRYLWKVWETGNDYEILESKLNETQIFFPYKTSATAQYKIKDILKNSNDTISVDLANWTQHIILENFNSEVRFTDFYSDFVGSDVFAYMIIFDKEVELIKENQEVQIDNEFGIFTYNISQNSPTQILINSYFLTKQYFIDKKDVIAVEQIYNGIFESEKTTLKVLLKGED